MKIKTRAIKCNICGEIFFPGNKANGEPNGVGFQFADGSIFNVCHACICKTGTGEIDPDTIKPSAE